MGSFPFSGADDNVARFHIPLYKFLILSAAANEWLDTLDKADASEEEEDNSANEEEEHNSANDSDDGDHHDPHDQADHEKNKVFDDWENLHALFTRLRNREQNPGRRDLFAFCIIL